MIFGAILHLARLVELGHGLVTDRRINRQTHRQTGGHVATAYTALAYTVEQQKLKFKRTIKLSTVYRPTYIHIRQ